MKKITLCIITLLMFTGVCHAGDLMPGLYGFDDGNMSMTINVMSTPDGKFFIDANGSTRDGKSCRVGDLAELRGNILVVGICQFDIDVQGDKFRLADSAKCASCQPGAYISGIYFKK